MYAFWNIFVIVNLARLKMENQRFKLNFHKNTYVKAMTFDFSNGVRCRFYLFCQIWRHYFRQN